MVVSILKKDLFRKWTYKVEADNHTGTLYSFTIKKNIYK